MEGPPLPAQGNCGRKKTVRDGLASRKWVCLESLSPSGSNEVTFTPQGGPQLLEGKDSVPWSHYKITEADGIDWEV